MYSCYYNIFLRMINITLLSCFNYQEIEENIAQVVKEN